MKRTVLTGIFLAAIALMGSCGKMLDIDNADGRVDMSEVWSSKSRASSYYQNCINTISNVGFIYDGTALASFCDEAYDASAYGNGAITRWYLGITSPSNNPLLSHHNYWPHYYEGIRKCNSFLQNMLPEETVGNYSELEKTGWLAQVYVARAYCYLQLIKRYGGVPIVTTPYEFDHDFSNDVRDSFEKCVDQIMADCDAALSYPEPEDSGNAAGFWWVRKNDQGAYMSRAIAWAIKSQAALYAASPLWYEEGSKYNWNKAAEITKAALDLCLMNVYALYKPASVDASIAQNAYAMLFILNPTSNNTIESETILRTRDFRTEVWRMAGLPINGVGVERAGAGPTQELVDAYEIVYQGQAYPLLDLKKPYKDHRNLEPNYNTGLPAGALDAYLANPYRNRDPRFIASIYYNGAQWRLNESDGINNRVYTEVDGNCSIATTVDDIKHTHTGYYMRKYNRSTSNFDNNNDGYMRIFRLAELYLNFAEAANNATARPDIQILSTVGGQPMSALDAVNAIRSRAGISVLAAGISKEDFELRYRNERRIEMAFEEQRFYDVRRWKILDQTDGYKTGMRIDGSGSNRFNVELSKSPTCADKYLMFPIDQSEISKMMKLTGTNWQNPGW